MMTDNARSGLSFPMKLFFFGAAAAGVAYLVHQQRRMEFAGKTVVIAGASRGLGLELARAFAKEGANLALLARDRPQLGEAARELGKHGVQVWVHACDISKEEEVRESIGAIIKEAGRIDVLVNNAGVIQVGPAEVMTTDDYAKAMGVHFWGPLYLMREVIPVMKRQHDGRIVNIASIGGKIAVPHLLPYVTSKFALVGLSEGMRAELAKDSIYVTTVCPGLMRTGSHLNAFFKGQHKKEFALFSIANASPLLSTTSTEAAQQIIEACRYGKAEVIITPQARFAHLVSRLFPSLVAESMSLVSWLLPKAGGAGARELKRGWESRSVMAPSFLTKAADNAAGLNNEEPRSPGSR